MSWVAFGFWVPEFKGKSFNGGSFNGNEEEGKKEKALTILRSHASHKGPDFKPASQEKHFLRGVSVCASRQSFAHSVKFSLPISACVTIENRAEHDHQEKIRGQKQAG
jgi:hypothetical protein